MRSFEERRAEVFRRSESRIKKRKRNRSRIIALCLSVCLASAVWSAGTLSSILPAATQKSAQAIDETESFDELSGSAAVRVSVLVERSGNESLADFVVEDASLAGRLREAVDTAFDRPVEADSIYPGYSVYFDGAGMHKEALGISSDSSSHTPAHEEPDYHEEPGYTITFTTKDAASSVYTLRGFLLTDCTVKRSVILTDAQHAGILDALARIMKGGHQ